MSESRPLVGVDVGSSTVSVIVAVAEGDELMIKGCGQARHDGARKGIIANLEEVSEAVHQAAEEAEAMAAVPVEQAVVGIGGAPVLGVPATASVPVTGRDQTVTAEDQERALNACGQVSVPEDYRVLDIIPCGFALDGHAGMNHPLGMPGRRLDASAFVLYTHKTHADTVEQAVNRAAVAVEEMIYEPLAAAEAVLTPDEKELGCLLLDIGYGSTEWLLYSEGVVMACGATNVAGRLFTSDLAVLLNTTTAAGERVKRKVGATMDREGLETEAVEVPALGGGGNQVHRAQFAAEVLYERGRDLFIRVHKELVAGGLDRIPAAGLVLTGGGSSLGGIQELAEEILGHRVRIGTPQALTGIIEPVSGPEWAVACGLVRMQHRRSERLPMIQNEKGSIIAWLRNALGEFFELGGGP
jgi:cell division protein FtsA